MISETRAATRLTKAAIAVVAVTLAAAAAFTGLGPAIDRALDPVRFGLVERPASGRLAIVEMDAASVAAIRRWPWSREHYARVVDQLRVTGAASVTFDVDFSSSSTPEGDAAFAASLKRADGLVALATLTQHAGSGDRRSLDSLPIPALREHAALAAVSIVPDPDGTIRSAPFGTVTRGTPRPSLSAYIAHRSGTADAFFPIDYSIDPASIPRLSFVDVRDGKVDRRAVAGRDILIGATAVEMGDRYAAPRWGVIPGVVIQALAAETLMRGVPIEGSAVVTIAVALLLALAILRARTTAAVAMTSVAALMALTAMVVATQSTLLRFYPLAPGLILLATVAAGRLAQDVAGRFQRQRMIDEATGLRNRRALLIDLADRPAVTLAVAHLANYDSLSAVLGGDADRDLVLRVAERLRLAAGGAVYRLGDRLLGFALSGDAPCDETLDGLRAVMLQPVEVVGRRVDAVVTIGVAEGAGATADACLTEAIMAADEAHREGVFWRRNVADLAKLEQQVSLMGELDAAIDAGGLEVHYQPKLALADDRIASVEALVRWRHPVRGFIGPDLFIPLAERTDRIAPLTLFVIERAMRDLARWRALGHELTAAVNISAKLLSSPGFNDEVRALIARGIVPPSSLTFEVTESAAIADPAAAVAALERYRDLGIAISMDDYGTGQSTLTYLRQLPLSELKIDRSFVQHAHLNRADGVLVRSTIELAHELGLKVVAEGVEDEACLAYLRELGCDLVQGYLVSRPVGSDALLALLAEPVAWAA